MNQPVFLKLGGSLITDKNQRQTPRMDVLRRLALEIAAARKQNPNLRLLIGHGSGSFGHMAAKTYATRQGVFSPEQWHGFAEVWQAARALNQIVIETLVNAGLPVIAMPPSAIFTAADGKSASYESRPLRAALEAGLIPLVNGDVVFDAIRGGTILSTEDVFLALANELNPRRILLSGIEEGVWQDFPTCQQLVRQITPGTLADFTARLGGSAAVDVTGGMADKVKSMTALVIHLPGLEVLIFSGMQPGSVQAALLGERPGTLISADNAREENR